MINEKKKVVKKDKHDAPLSILREPELTKDNCSPELWNKLGGNTLNSIDDEELPF